MQMLPGGSEGEREEEGERGEELQREKKREMGEKETGRQEGGKKLVRAETM